MADIYPTLQHPNKLLARPGKLVEAIDKEVEGVIVKMQATLAVQENCAALAATQLGVELCITVINHSVVMDGFLGCYDASGVENNFISAENKRPLCLINPKIIDRSELMVNEAEGCMSVGGKIHEKVKRNKEISCEFLTETNVALVVKAEGFFARCIQHELDHLQGVLFIDKLSPLKRKIVDRKFMKRNRSKV